MKTTETIAVPNSVLLIMDPKLGIVPDTLGNQRVSSTGSCIAIGTAMEYDKMTTVTLITEPSLAPNERPKFRATIAVPRNMVAVCNVFRQPVLSVPHYANLADVTIWSNDPSEPDRITVLIR